MIQLNEKNIGKFNLLITFVILTIFAIIISIFSVNSRINDFELLKTNVKNEFIQQNKISIKNRVEQIISLIQNQDEQSIYYLKSTIKQRVYNSHSIAQKIYEKYKETKTQEEIIELVKEVLRPLRYDNGTGYMFMASLNGIDLLFPVLPQVENTDILNLQDARGNFVIKEEIDIVKKHQEGYIKDYWTKPNAIDKTMIYPKITFIKIFKPLNLYIGTGMYIDDAKEKSKDYIKELVVQMNKQDRLNYLTISEFNRADVSKKSLTIIIHPDLAPGSIIKDSVIGDLSTLKSKDETYLYYKFKNLITQQNEYKTTFLKYHKSWKWVIETGFYSNELDKAITLWEKKQSELIQEQVYTHIFLLLLFGSILLALIYLINNFTQNIFYKYQNDVSKKELALKNLNENLENKVKTRTLELQESSDNFKFLFDNTIEAIGIFQNNICIDINEAGFKLFKFKTKEDAIGIKTTDFIAPDSIELVKQKLSNYHNALYEVNALKRDGEIFPVLVKGYTRTVKGEQVRVISLFDISGLKDKEIQLQLLNKELTELTNIDPLTGIYNRRYFYNISKDLIALSKRECRELSLAIIDIDDFKQINDTHGHDIGDEILKLLVEKVAKNIRDSDIIIRFGGEEFIVIFPNTSTKEAVVVIEKIREIVSLEKFMNAISFTISIGISKYQENDEGIEPLFKRADLALYRAKRSGKNRINIYNLK